jgi:UDP-2,4-diacetamido-2,4,6-trideoxy-beta-L-altropyranose hydrolase
VEAPFITLRAAGQDDRELLFRWVNDPAVRESSFSSAPVAWDEHVAWFERQQADPNVVIYVACDRDGTPVAQVRLRSSGDRADISVSVAADHRGRGYGAVVIRSATDRFLAERADVHIVDAWVKPTNAPSTRSFAAAGYVPAGRGEVGGHAASHLIAERHPS